MKPGPHPKKRVEEEKEPVQTPINLLDDTSTISGGTEMADLTSLLTKTNASAGKIGTWQCGTAIIKTPLLLEVVSTVHGSKLAKTDEDKRNYFCELMISKKKAGVAFLEALDVAKVDYLDFINYILNFQGTRGRSALVVKAKKVLGKVLAIQYPVSTSMEDMFSGLIEQLGNVEVQKQIFATFQKFTAFGTDEQTGKVHLRKPLTEKQKTAAIEQGKKLGAARKNVKAEGKPKVPSFGRVVPVEEAKEVFEGE
jgi:hypothetical protein